MPCSFSNGLKEGLVPASNAALILAADSLMGLPTGYFNSIFPLFRETSERETVKQIPVCRLL
jgi:hypothetical protein